MTGGQCRFGYRTSVFKRTAWPGPGSEPGSQAAAVPGPTGRYVVLDVTFALERDPMSVPVKYAELARKLAVEVGDRAPLADVRAAVLDLRRGKGMVLDPADPDTVSAGSFFTNAVLGPGELAEAGTGCGRPQSRYPSADLSGRDRGGRRVVPGSVKVPAAWLIEQAGFGKGYPGSGAARISSKHTLALTNAGGARTAELIGLAREIAAGVAVAFGIELAQRAGAGRGDALAVAAGPDDRAGLTRARAPSWPARASVSLRTDRVPPARRRCLASSRVLTSSGAAEPRTDIRGEPGQSRVVEPVDVPGQLVLGGQPGPEQQRVVGPERDRYARVEQRGSAARRPAVAATPSATFDAGQTSSVICRPASRLTSAGSVAAPTPWPTRSACRSSHAAADALRAEQFAAVRDREQPGPGRDPERRGEVGGAPAPLVAGQAEAGHAASRVAGREPGHRPRVERMPASGSPR